MGVNWSQTLKKFSICLPGKTPSAPSDKGSDTEDDEAEVQNELEAESSELAQASAFLATGEDPESYEEVITSADRDEWLAAMDSKMESITSVGTFELVHAPCDRKPIGCRWVYCIKCTASSEISQYKARLIAQGFTQKPSIDFTKMFAPIAKTDFHWGQGYPEMSGNILGTFQGLGQFYCTVTNRYIYRTFRMCC